MVRGEPVHVLPQIRWNFYGSFPMENNRIEKIGTEETPNFQFSKPMLLNYLSFTINRLINLVENCYIQFKNNKKGLRPVFIIHSYSKTILNINILTININY